MHGIPPRIWTQLLVVWVNLCFRPRWLWYVIRGQKIKKWQWRFKKIEKGGRENDERESTLNSISSVPKEDYNPAMTRRNVGKERAAFSLLNKIRQWQQHFQRWRVQPINQKRKDQGDHVNLITEMWLLDTQSFHAYIWMSKVQPDKLHHLIGPRLEEQTTFFEVQYLQLRD